MKVFRYERHVRGSGMREMHVYWVLGRPKRSRYPETLHIMRRGYGCGPKYQAICGRPTCYKDEPVDILESGLRRCRHCERMFLAMRKANGWDDLQG